MAGLRYPLGNQRRVISDPTLPPEDVLLEPAHALLLEEQDRVLRNRTPLAPPEEAPADPWLVPKSIWRKVESEAVRRTAATIATRHDALDLAVNIRKEAETETAMGQFDDPPRRVFDPGSNLGIWRLENELVNRKFQRALLRPDEPRRRPLTRSEAELPVFGGPSIYGGDQSPILMGERAARQQTVADIRRSESVVGTVGVVRGAADKLGGTFDGKRFVKYLAVRAAVGMDELRGGDVFGGSVAQADARFEEVYKDLPRPVQLVIEEMSPGNMAIAVAGGALANALRAAAPAGAKGVPLRAMASLFEPIKGIGGAAFRPAAGSVLGRIGYEQTEGAPMPIRLATGAAGMLLGARPDAVLSPASAWARDVWRATTAVPTNVPARATETVLSARIIPQIGRTNLTTAGIGAVAGAATGDTWEERRDRALMGAGIGLGAGAALQSMRYHTTFKPPDILDDLYDPAAHGVRFTEPATNGARFARQDGIDYAADLGQQLGQDVPVGVAHSLQMARAGIREGGQAMERVIGEMPWVRDGYAALFNPSSKIPLNVRQAWFAAGGAMNRLGARLNPSRYYYLDAISKSFGGLDDATKVKPSAAMPRLRPARTGALVDAAAHPHFGKLIDIWAHPEWYDLSDEQVLLMEQFNQRNLKALQEVRDFYGVDIGEFEPDKLFVPIVDRKGVKVDADAAPSRLAGVAGRLKERTFANPGARLEDPIFGATFDPETDFSKLFTELDAAKISAAGNSVMRWGVGGAKERSADAFFETQWGTFVPESHRDALEHFERGTAGADGVINFFDEWRATRLNADGSPLTIQGSMAWFADWTGTAKQIVSAVSNGQWNPLDWGRVDRLAENMAADPESWLDFAFHAGLRPSGAVPEEFAASFAGSLPGIGKQIGAVNQQLMNLNIYAMKRIWDEDVALLAREGVPLEAAKAAAADTVTKIIPMTAGRKLGLSPRRATLERAAATSVSFIRQPIAFMSEAASGYIKLGMKPAGIASGTAKQWATLTPHERLAVHRFTRMAGTFMGMATASAVLTADDRRLSKWEAAQRAMTPGTADFLRLWLGPNVSIPVGGPYRGLIQAIAPRNGQWGAGLVDFAETRVAPLASTVGQLYRNRDYFQNQIIEGDFPENLVRALEFAVEQAAPISVTTPAQAARAGIPQEDAALSVLGGFFGQNPRDIPDYERIQIARRDGFIQLAADPSVERYMDNGLSQVQAEAAMGAQSLDELAERIGSRAANAVAERSSARFRDDYDGYIEELTRRAERGDRDARALLVQVRTQDELDALSRNMRTETAAGPVLNREAYRRGRSDIIMRGIGASAEYEDIFSKMRQSPNEIDQLTAQWYDLIKRAYIPGTKNVDFDVFNAIEAQFFAGMDAKQAELVQANVQTPLRRASVAEEELRQVRRDLEASGFFEVEQETWEKFRKQPGTGPLAPANFETFIEYRKATVRALADKLIAKGLSPEHALGVADNEAKGANPVISAYDKVVTAFHAKWAKENPELAQQAQAWGYLSYSDLNIAASGAVRPQPSATVSAAGQKSEVSQIVELWEKERLSYGQIANKLGKTDGAVEQALRRHYEQLYLIKSPVEGRLKSTGQ